MAVFIDLHFVTGADPAAQFGFRLLVWIKVTRTEGLADLFNVPRQPLDDHVGYTAVRMQIRPGLFGKLFGIGAHFDEILLARLLHGVLSSPQSSLRPVVSAWPRTH